MGASSQARQMQRDLATVRQASMLDQVDALPRAQSHAAADHRNREVHARQHGLEVGGHVVRPFVVVGIARPFGRDAVEPVQQVAAYFPRRILLNQQGGRGVAAEQGKKPLGEADVLLPGGDRAGDIGETPTKGVERKDGGGLFHRRATLDAVDAAINRCSSEPKRGRNVTNPASMEA